MGEDSSALRTPISRSEGGKKTESRPRWSEWVMLVRRLRVRRQLDSRRLGDRVWSLWSRALEPGMTTEWVSEV